MDTNRWKFDHNICSRNLTISNTLGLGGVASNGGNTNDISGGIALNGGQDYPGCNVAVGSQCFNVPGR